MQLPHEDFLVKYGWADSRNKKFLVNDFSHIGWDDPFSYEPKDENAMLAAQLAQEHNLYDKSIG